MDDLIERLRKCVPPVTEDWEMCKEAADALEQAQTQIDALQQKVHLCAGYDELRAENTKLVHDINRYVGIANEHVNRTEQLEAALRQVIEWSDQYQFSDGSYETDRGEPGDIAREALQKQGEVPHGGPNDNWLVPKTVPDTDGDSQ